MNIYILSYDNLVQVRAFSFPGCDFTYVTLITLDDSPDNPDNPDNSLCSLIASLMNIAHVISMLIVQVKAFCCFAAVGNIFDLLLQVTWCVAWCAIGKNKPQYLYSF